MSKIKHLVLLRDKELAEKNASLKEAQLQVEKMRSEMARLRRQEEHLSDVQVCLLDSFLMHPLEMLYDYFENCPFFDFLYICV